MIGADTRRVGRAEPTAPAGLPRLLDGMASDGRPVGLADHLARWGPPHPWTRRRPGQVVAEIEAAGLRGRGGAWFPTARKWRAVAAGRRRPVVVANGAEAEPASRKDRVMLERAPHLVLDGVSLAAAAVGAARAVVYVSPALVPVVSAAVAQRAAHQLDPLPLEVVAAASSFLAGEESAVVAHLNGGAGAVPSYTGLRPVYQRGVGGRPTLVQNVETLAHAGLIARFGAGWFREMGTDASPGTALLSVSAPPRPAPVVVEVALGTTLRSVMGAAGIDPSGLGAVLVGGYGGAWLACPDALDLALSPEALGAAGAVLGAGVVVGLPAAACPLAETARLAAYLASQSAGQCGPCANGLPALADTMAALAWRPRSHGAALGRRVEELAGQVAGRGACHHPDGVVRMLRSSLRVFSDHAMSHLHHGPCRAAGAPGLLAVPGIPRRGAS